MRSSLPLAFVTATSVKLFLALDGLSPSSRCCANALVPLAAVSSTFSTSLRNNNSNSNNKGGMSSSNIAMSSGQSLMDEIKVGATLPNIKVTEYPTGSDNPTEVEINDLVQGKKVAIFGVPGAFTPGCDKKHLPSFIEAQEALKAKGIEETFCVATNDAFVMQAWGRMSGGADAGIRFLSDSNAEFTEALGLIMETPVMKRCKRFSLIADNGVVTHFFDAAEQSSDTWAPNVLKALE
ncbi:hypothetical protein ACA910_019500 [Epithemia clementina (nom. ined.)]